MEGLVFKIIQDSEFENTMKIVFGSGDLFSMVGNSRIDGRTIFKMTYSKSWERYCKIHKIMNQEIIDESYCDVQERIMDKLHGHIELVSTLEDHMRGFYPSA